MFLPREQLRFISSVNHEGKVVVIGIDAEGHLAYTIKQDGFEDSYGGTQLQGWEDWQSLDLPDEDSGTWIK